MYNKFKKYFLAVIECTFQNNICQWTKLTTDDSGNFQWTRKNARQLAADNIPGPQKDWFWNVLMKMWPVYSEVLLASFLINCFALVINRKKCSIRHSDKQQMVNLTVANRTQRKPIKDGISFDFKIGAVARCTEN